MCLSIPSKIIFLYYNFLSNSPSLLFHRKMFHILRTCIPTIDIFIKYTLQNRIPGSNQLWVLLYPALFYKLLLIWYGYTLIFKTYYQNIWEIWYEVKSIHLILQTYIYNNLYMPWHLNVDITVCAAATQYVKRYRVCL